MDWTVSTVVSWRPVWRLCCCSSLNEGLGLWLVQWRGREEDEFSIYSGDKKDFWLEGKVGRFQVGLKR